MHYSRLGHPSFALPRPSMGSYLLLLGRCSRRGSRFLFLTELYLVHPWTRTSLHLTTMDGGNAKGLYGTILALWVAVFVPPYI